MAEITRSINLAKGQLDVAMPAKAMVTSDFRSKFDQQRFDDLVVNLMAKWEADRKTRLLPMLLGPDNSDGSQGQVVLWGAAQLYINNLTNPQPVNLLNGRQTQKHQRERTKLAVRKVLSALGIVLGLTLLSWGGYDLLKTPVYHTVVLKDLEIGRHFLFEHQAYVVVNHSANGVVSLSYGKTYDFSGDLRVEVVE